MQRARYGNVPLGSLVPRRQGVEWRRPSHSRSIYSHWCSTHGAAFVGSLGGSDKAVATADRQHGHQPKMHRQFDANLNTANQFFARMHHPKQAYIIFHAASVRPRQTLCSHLMPNVRKYERKPGRRLRRYTMLPFTRAEFTRLPRQTCITIKQTAKLARGGAFVALMIAWVRLKGACACMTHAALSSTLHSPKRVTAG